MSSRGLGQAICHIGLGNFSRAHLAGYQQSFLDRVGPCEWGICAIDRDTPRTKEMMDYMNKTGWEYTLKLESATQAEDIQLKSINGLINLGTDPGMAMAQLTSPSTRIVSMTITEKGYYCDVVTGDLLFDNAELKHDLENILMPKSMHGLVIGALKIRKENGLPPFTIMSCDNLPGNGHITQHALLQFAERYDPELAKWMESNVTFPNTMVDRITPNTPSADAPVVAEPFRQWVVEDSFCNGRPYWEVIQGDELLLVADVMPYELMKVRLLNGSHSALAYSAYLSGERIVDEAMSNEVILNFVTKYMNETKQTVPPVPGINLDNYCKILLERFSNPKVKDTTARLCEDGSMKALSFWKPVILDHAKAGQPMYMMALAVACWIRYMAAIDDAGEVIQIKDPSSPGLLPLAKLAMQTKDVIPFLDAAFGPEVSQLQSFTPVVAAWYVRLCKEGVAKVIGSLDEFAMGFTMPIQSVGVDTSNLFAKMGTVQLQNLYDAGTMAEIFDKYDADNSNTLDYMEVQNAMRDLLTRLKELTPTAVGGLLTSLQLPEEKIEERIKDTLDHIPDPADESFVRMVFSRLDANGDGAIEREEFYNGFREAFEFRSMNPVDAQAEAFDDSIQSSHPKSLGPTAWGNMASWARKSRN